MPRAIPGDLALLIPLASLQHLEKTFPDIKNIISHLGLQKTKAALHYGSAYRNVVMHRLLRELGNKLELVFSAKQTSSTTVAAGVTITFDDLASWVGMSPTNVKNTRTTVLRAYLYHSHAEDAGLAEHQDEFVQALKVLFSDSIYPSIAELEAQRRKGEAPTDYKIIKFAIEMDYTTLKKRVDQFKQNTALVLLPHFRPSNEDLAKMRIQPL